jgi:Zn finger protein HypA/HybF involved in hydrogenase expression
MGAQVTDIEIIANCLFNSILKNFNYSEENILDTINKNNKLLVNRFKSIEDFEANFIYRLINDIQKKIEKIEIGEDIITKKINGSVDEIKGIHKDIINIIDKKYQDLCLYINDKIDIAINNMKDVFHQTFLNNNLQQLSKQPSKNKKGRNSKLTDDKKYCNCKRSRGNSLCKIMIYKDEEACYAHKHIIKQQPQLSIKELKPNLIKKDKACLEKVEENINDLEIKNNCNNILDFILDDKYYFENIEKDLIKSADEDYKRNIVICKNKIDNELNIDKMEIEDEENEKLIKCLNCNSYIPEIVNDKLCCYCGSNDKYWL